MTDLHPRRTSVDPGLTMTLRIPGQEPSVWEDVPVQRIPVAGDLIEGPDDMGIYRVKVVQLIYDKGFYYEPSVYVVAGPV